MILPYTLIQVDKPDAVVASWRFSSGQRYDGGYDIRFDDDYIEQLQNAFRAEGLKISATTNSGRVISHDFEVSEIEHFPGEVTDGSIGATITMVKPDWNLAHRIAGILQRTFVSNDDAKAQELAIRPGQQG